MSDFMLPQMHEVDAVADTDMLSVVVGGVDRKIQAKNVSGTLIKDRNWTRGSTANALDDEFNTDALNSAWVRYDSVANVVTHTVGGDVLSMNQTGGGDNAGPAHCLLRPFGGLTSPLVITTATRGFRRYATNYQMLGPIFTDGVLSSSKAVWQMPYSSTNGATSQTLSTRTYNALNGGEAGNAGPDQTWEIIGNGPLYQRLTWVSANTFRSEYSPDGVSWKMLPVADFTFTITPTHFGIAMSNWTSGQAYIGSVEFIRVS